MLGREPGGLVFPWIVPRIRWGIEGVPPNRRGDTVTFSTADNLWWPQQGLGEAAGDKGAESFEALRRYVRREKGELPSDRTVDKKFGQ